LVSGRWLRGQLYELTPYDPASLAVAVGVLSVVALSAGFLPARRAALVDPMAALRKD
jgi:ABC-type lipoprotein release transport system permease subunit